MCVYDVFLATYVPKCIKPFLLVKNVKCCFLKVMTNSLQTFQSVYIFAKCTQLRNLLSFKSAPSIKGFRALKCFSKSLYVEEEKCQSITDKPCDLKLICCQKECIYNSRVGQMSKRVVIPSDGMEQEHSLVIIEEDQDNLAVLKVGIVHLKLL